MSELFPLGIQVALGSGVWLDFARNTFGYLDSGGFDSGDLLRIIREQANLLESKRFQDFTGKLELAVISLEAELFVRLDSIESFVLKFIGLEFGHQANSPPFLLLVDQHARA